MGTANTETVYAVDVIIEKVVDAIKENTAQQSEIAAALVQMVVEIRALSGVLDAK
jgi:hypothetical protein